MRGGERVGCAASDNTVDGAHGGRNALAVTPTTSSTRRREIFRSVL